MKRRRWKDPSDVFDVFLEAVAEVRPRFHEIDVMGVVWHGHYLNFFEEGRMEFGRRYDFSYQTIQDAGYVAPLVRAEVDYFKPARFDEPLTVRTRLHPTPGAWITYTYLVRNAEGDKLAGGKTVQAFTDLSGELVLTRPGFYDEFLKRHGCDGST